MAIKKRYQLSLVANISDSDAARLISLVYDTDKDGKRLRNILSVAGKAVGQNTHPANKSEEAFCERMVCLGIMNTIVSSWGYEETQYVITTLGMEAIKAIRKHTDVEAIPAKPKKRRI